jgi:hypothetical protein
MTPAGQRLIKQVRNNPLCLEDIPPDQITATVAKVMIQECPDVETLNLVPDHLKDQQFYLDYLSSKAIELDPERLLNVPKSFQTEELLLEAMKLDGKSVAFIEKSQMTEPVLVAAVYQNSEALFEIPRALRTPAVYKSALNSYDGFHVWDTFPEELRSEHSFQLKALHAAIRQGAYDEFADEIIARGMSDEIKVEALRYRHQMLAKFPVEERIELVRQYTRTHDFPWSWFEDSDDEFPEEPLELFKLAVKEPSVAKQIAILQRIDGCSLETLMPMARGPKQKQLLRGIYGTMAVASLLKPVDNVKGHWFREELGV